MQSAWLSTVVPPPRHSRESGNPASSSVTGTAATWIPAFAGMTKKKGTYFIRSIVTFSTTPVKGLGAV
jgi:hypothetical protein